METTEIRPTTPPDANGEVRQQLEGIRQLVLSVLILVIVISGTLNIYLWRQVRYTRADLASYKQQVGPMMDDFQRISAPVMREFVARLQEYRRSGKSDETLNAILNRYGIVGTNAASAAPVAPIQTNPPAPKKQ